MKQSEENINSFNQIELDKTLINLASQKISEADRQKILMKLCYDSGFRESFCDWIKILRPFQGDY
mgnify:CR=1 FL=1